MTSLDELKNILHEKNASLVVCFQSGKIKEYYSNRVTDIKNILNESSNALNGAIIADKVIGKVAASLLTVAGVKEIYAEVISKFAIPVLEQNNIKFEYNEKVEYIKNNEGTGMCPMENRFKDEQNINIIYKEIIGK